MKNTSDRESLDHVIHLLAWRRHEWEMKDRTHMSEAEIEMEMKFEAKDTAAIELLASLRKYS